MNRFVPISYLRPIAATTICLVVFAGALGDQEKGPPDPEFRPATRLAAEQAIDRAIAWFIQKRGPNGGWQEEMGPAITALVAKCFLQHEDYGPSSPISMTAIEHILAFQQPDGGIYRPGTYHENYETSVALMALATAGGKEYEQSIANGQRRLVEIQFKTGMNDRDGRDVTIAHPYFGGSGYGHRKRPDLSNTQMMVEALHEIGVPSDDPALRRALAFVTRCQMLSESNDQTFARSAGGDNVGGFVYTPADTGDERSKAGYIGQGPTRQLRSYGSMTYAGFKCMLYADVDREDQRVQAAWQWIRAHYDLDHNPNMPGQQRLEGLFYFYQVFAKAMKAWDKPILTDAQGVKHNWREDLCQAVVQRQRTDGSWVNEEDRWMESIPELVTAYSVLALQAALQ
jgi:squalene-hopene/tetraprenyl-beta-curcumene cyclase